MIEWLGRSYPCTHAVLTGQFGDQVQEARTHDHAPFATRSC